MIKLRITTVCWILFSIYGCCWAASFGANSFARRSEDAQYWRTNGEQQLTDILAKLRDAGVADNKLEAKNVIIFVGDGMGMSTVTAARIFKGQQNGKMGEEEQMVFEQFPNIGLAKTYNVDKQVPDSAGTATAIFTGIKTDYSVIGLDITHQSNSTSIGAITSIMDWALAAGKRTGFVTTTRVTHATPSALYAHISNRNWECDSMVPVEYRDTVKDIARQLVEQQPGNQLNVILGGGRKMMGVSSDGNGDDDVAVSIDGPLSIDQLVKFKGLFEQYCTRNDSRNLVDEWLNAKTDKAIFVQNTNELMSIEPSDINYLMGLFADNHMTYSSLRDTGPNGEPSLAQMTRQAIRVLQSSSHHNNGFVLMVEGGRIDQAHHQNHARLALEETIAMDEAILMALTETSRHDTLIIVTADHSHSMTLNGYAPRGNDILGFANKTGIELYETLSYANGPGFNMHRSFDVQGTATNGSDKRLRDGTWLRLDTFDATKRKSPYYMNQAMIYLDDETHGGEDVAVYAIGPGSELIRGNFEQNYIAHAIGYAACIGPSRSNLCSSMSTSNLATERLVFLYSILLLGNVVCFFLQTKI